jgi:predicted anti-sigma-YlaC factor YlaD
MPLAAAGLFLLVASAGCSVRKTAVDLIGDAISEGGGVYAADEDPQLIREAIPFGLKTYESLLATSPDHEGLLLAAAKGFAAYAYLIQKEADKIDAADLARARAERERASKLFLRGRDYALRGLELGHPGITERLYGDREAALAETAAEDVPLLYWAGAAWAGALSADKGNMALIGDLAIAAALVERVVELDETYDFGSAHEFLISYEGARPGGSAEQARVHYRRALELSQGARATTHLALAESVAVKQQDIEEFRDLLAAAQAVDLERMPRFRLVNTVAQDRARWLKGRIEELFVDLQTPE